jgi:hypothetical protein
MIHVQFAGDPTHWNELVGAALHETFDRRDFFGMVEVTLAYTAGRGYQVLRASHHIPGVAVGAESLPAPEVVDATADVRAVLERIGAPLA